MATDEIEGTPAEATWAMLTVIIIIIVVIIFCCALPFYRALEKRWHHWDDLGNDPRWDVENFQFSPTSPQLTRDPKYNRLSICSTENGSSMGTSSSGINRGDSFKNNSVMPRFPDQVEFRLPPSYDDLFSKGGEAQCEEAQPRYFQSTESEKEEITKSQYQEEVFKPQVMKNMRKQLPSTAAAAAPAAAAAAAAAPAAAGIQDKKVGKTAASSLRTNNNTAELNGVQSKLKSGPGANTQLAKEIPPAQDSPPAPAPAKRNSKVVNKPSQALKKANPALSKPGSVVSKPSSVVSKPGSGVSKPSSGVSKPSSATMENNSTTPQTAPVAPVKKTYKKLKKSLPTDGAVNTE